MNHFIRLALLLTLTSPLFASDQAASPLELNPVGSRLPTNTRHAVPSADLRFAEEPLSASSSSVSALARDLYIWAWPMVYLHNAKGALSRLPGPGRSD